jgi:hypothetical protein
MNGVGLVFVGDGAQRSQVEAAHVITIEPGLEGVVVPSEMYGTLAPEKPLVAVAPKEADVVSLGIRRGFAVLADHDRPAEGCGSCPRFS